MRTLCPEPTNSLAKRRSKNMFYIGISFITKKRGAEQQKQKKATSEEIAFILDRYVNRWQRWAAAGLQGIKIDVYEQIRYQRVLIQIERLLRVPVLLRKICYQMKQKQDLILPEWRERSDQ
jgi:hypothetical protein